MANSTAMEVEFMTTTRATTVNDIKCSICLSVLKSPMQAVPCGHRFCRTCIESVRTSTIDGKLLCPEDRGEIQIYPDVAKEREIMNSQVKCSNNISCMWIGEYRALKGHLDVCEYQKVQCKNTQCTVIMERRHSQLHLQTECRYRVVKCPFCNTFYMFLNEQLHQENCEFFPMECAFQCGQKAIPRNEMKQHTEGMCTKAVLPCKYANIGCTEKGTRSQLEKHTSQSTEVHLNYAMTTLTEYETRFSDMERRLVTMEQRMQQYPTSGQHGRQQTENNRNFTTQHEDMRIETVQNQQFDNIAVMLPTCPYIIGIENFSSEFDLAISENKKSYSKPFYCLQGYRAQLKVFLNGWGSGRGTHVSVYIKFMPGPFDEVVDWPFRGIVKISLCGRHKMHEKLMNTDKIKENDSSEMFQKPAYKPTQGKGFSKFLSHSHVNDYVIDDTITFKVNVFPL